MKEDIISIYNKVKPKVIELGYSLRESKNNLTTNLKESLDIVTNMDFFIQDEIIKFIQHTFNKHQIFSEELKNEYPYNLNKFIWILDPIDGTINYASGLPFYSISLALQKNNITLLGIIFAPELNEFYYSIKGKGAFLNEKQIYVSNKNFIKESTISFMLTSHYSEKENEIILSLIKSISPYFRGLRLLVCLSLELGYIASGRLDGTLCIKSRGYSSAAGVLLVKEAKGQITNLSGEVYSMQSKNILATNKNIHDQIIKLIN